MSANCVAASSQYLEALAAPMGAAPHPWTMFGWVNLASLTGFQALMHAGDASATDFGTLSLDTSPDDKLEVRHRTPGSGSSTLSSVASLTTGAWLPASASFVGTAERHNWLNGVKASSTSANSAHAGFDQLSIGRVGSTLDGDYLDGQIAECAWFDRELSDAEHVALHNGLWPRSLNPVCYLPLRLVTEVVDEVSGITFTNNGATQGASHPNIYIPKRGLELGEFALTGGGMNGELAA